jgi:cytochrome c-type biogenesis protein
MIAAQSGLQGALLGPAGFVVAFFVGMVSFFSPCILPLLPGYLSYVSGLSGEEMEAAEGRRKVLLGISLFVLGFATMFTLLGIVASALGQFFTRNLATIERVAGAIVIVMGLAFVAPSLFPFLERERRPLLQRVRPGVAGAYPLGLAFAAGWTPCVGPGLGVILTLGTVSGSVWRAALLLVFFSFGFGVWFVLAGLGMRRALAASDWLRRHARVIQTAGGVLMIAIGVLLVTDQWNNLIAPLRRLTNDFTPPV